MGSAAGAVWLQLALQFPTDSYLGLGFGDRMTRADVVLCAAVRGAVGCFDMFVDVRSAGPRTDTSLGGSSDVEVVDYSIKSGRASATVNKRLVTSDTFDARISPARQNLIVAFQSVGEEADVRDGNSVAHYHGLEQRGLLLGVDLRLGAANVGGSQALATQAREAVQNRSVHGVMMFLTWAVIIVVGAVVARYERHHENWLLTHRVLQSVGTLISLPGFMLTVDFDTGLTAHHVVGLTLLAWSYCQASCGAYIYYASLASAQFAAAAGKDGGRLSECAKHVVAQLALEHGADSALRQVRLALERDEGQLSPQIRDELGEELQACATQHARCCAPPRAVLGLLTMLALRPLRSFHRWSGRTLPLLAFAQIYLGAAALRVSASVKWLIVSWCALIALFVLAKEAGMQYARHRETLHGLKESARARFARRTTSSPNRTSSTPPPQDPPPLRDVGLSLGSVHDSSAVQPGSAVAPANDEAVGDAANKQQANGLVQRQHDPPRAAQAQPPQGAGDSGSELSEPERQIARAIARANILELA
jgi:hypothetical protein